MTKEKLSIAKIEDHEGLGRCGACEREGLRWIVVLSDGSQIGTECAKKVLGWKINRDRYAWLNNYEPVAEGVDCDTTFVLYRRRDGRAYAIAQNGAQLLSGPPEFALHEWRKYGFDYDEQQCPAEHTKGPRP